MLRLPLSAGQRSQNHLRQTAQASAGRQHAQLRIKLLPTSRRLCATSPRKRSPGKCSRNTPCIWNSGWTPPSGKISNSVRTSPTCTTNSRAPGQRTYPASWSRLAWSSASTNLLSQTAIRLTGKPALVLRLHRRSPHRGSSTPTSRRRRQDSQALRPQPHPFAIAAFPVTLGPWSPWTCPCRARSGQHHRQAWPPHRATSAPPARPTPASSPAEATAPLRLDPPPPSLPAATLCVDQERRVPLRLFPAPSSPHVAPGPSPAALAQRACNHNRP